MANPKADAMRLNYDNVHDDVEVRHSDSPKRPYPGVKLAKDCTNRWEGYYSNNGRVIRLGTFDTPEAARCAVLIAQAEYLETKAARYRAEAAKIAAGEQ